MKETNIVVESGVSLPTFPKRPKNATVNHKLDRLSESSAVEENKNNWNELGEAGGFMMIDKRNLHIDHGYQRDKISRDRINAMAANWSWVSCGCLCIAKRNSRWFVVDGQHRKLAADKRSDIKEMPCLVFNLESRKQEAKSFVELNSNKSAVAGVDRFKAMIVAGDQTAIELGEILDASNRQPSVTPSPSSVACIILLWHRYSSDPELFQKVWPLILEMSNGHPIHNCIVRAVWWAESISNELGKSILIEPYRGLIINAGASFMKSEIERERAIIGYGGSRVEGSTLIKWLNNHKMGRGFKIQLANIA